MAPWQLALLVPAGYGAGLTGSVAGLASLVSYPALLAVGLPPVTANVSNTVALVFSTLGSVSNSRTELHGQAPRARRLGVVGILGGATGGALLLSTPAGAFEKIVPVLIAFASAIILATARRAPTPPQTGAHLDNRLVLVGVFAVGVYGGYFGAAAGVLLLALLLATGPDTLARSNALKNVVLGLANSIAAVSFVLFASVSWAATVPLAVGLFLGGRTGPAVVRRVDARALRVLIAFAGLGLALYLGLDAYR